MRTLPVIGWRNPTFLHYETAPPPSSRPKLPPENGDKKDRPAGAFRRLWVSMCEGAHVKRAHLGKRCASSKESPRFSKMRTSREWCASSKSRAHLRRPILDCRYWIAPKSKLPNLFWILDFGFWIAPESKLPTLQTPAHLPRRPPADNLDIRSGSTSPFEASGVNDFPNPKSKIQNLKSPPIKKAVPGSLIQARLRVCEIYSLWLYRISSFVSLIIRDEVDPFNSKIL